MTSRRPRDMIRHIGTAPTLGNARTARQTLGNRCSIGPAATAGRVDLENRKHSAAIRIDVRLYYPRRPVSVAGPFAADLTLELVLSILWLIAVVWLLLRALRQQSAIRASGCCRRRRCRRAGSESATPAGSGPAPPSRPTGCVSWTPT